MELLLALLIIGFVVVAVLAGFVWLVSSSERLDAGEDSLGSDSVAGVVRPDARRAGPPSASKSRKYLSEDESAYYLVRDGDGRLPVRVSGGFFVHDGRRKQVPPEPCADPGGRAELLGKGFVVLHGRRSGSGHLAWYACAVQA